MSIREEVERFVQAVGGRLSVQEPLSGGVGTVTVDAPAANRWKWGGGTLIVTTYGGGAKYERTEEEAFRATRDRIALGLIADTPPTPRPYRGEERRRG